MRRMAILTTAAAGIWSIVLANPLWAHEPTCNGVPCGQHMMWWFGGWSGMMLGPLLMILVPVVLVVALLLALRRFWPPSSAQPTTPLTPLDVLKERFARGEIDKQEYEERRRTISEPGQ